MVKKLDLKKFKNGGSTVEQEKINGIVKETKVYVSFDIDEKLYIDFNYLLLVKDKMSFVQWANSIVGLYINDKIEIPDTYSFGTNRENVKRKSVLILKSLHDELTLKLKREGKYLRFLILSQIENYVEENKTYFRTRLN